MQKRNELELLSTFCFRLKITFYSPDSVQSSTPRKNNYYFYTHLVIKEKEGVLEPCLKDTLNTLIMG